MTDKKHKIILIIVTAFVVVVGIVAIWYILNGRKVADVTTYDECAAAGYPILETYPEQCAAPNGKKYTRIVEKEKKVTLEGRLTCLSHKNADGPHTMECASGIKTDDGKYYGLSSDPYNTSLSETGRTIHVEGTLKVDSSTQYLSEGTVIVSSHRLLD